MILILEPHVTSSALNTGCTTAARSPAKRVAGITVLLAAIWGAGTAVEAAVGGGGFAMPGGPTAPTLPGATPTAQPAVAAGGNPAAPWLRLELTDGTLLGGAPAEAGPVFDSSLGTVQPAWKDVDSLQLTDAPGGDAIRLRSGDLARGDLRTTLIGVTSVIGRARIATTKIKSVTVGAAGGAAPEIVDGLVLYMPFDADERNRVADRSPAGNDGRLVAGRIIRPGRIGGALECDGAQTQVQIMPSASISPQRLTLAIWCKTKREISRTQHMLLVRQPHGMAGGYALGFEPDENGDSVLTFKVMTRMRSPGYYYCRFRERFQSGAWYHVAATYDGKRQRLYVNGELKASNPVDLEITYDPIQLHIGAQRDVQPTGYWDGWLDEARVYNRALDESEIRRLALMGGGPVATASAAPAGATPLRLEVRLNDETVVRGTAAWTLLPLTSATLGKLELPWARVAEVSQHAMQGATVTLDSGDILTGELGFQKATLDSSLGRVTVLRENLKTLRVLRE